MVEMARWEWRGGDWRAGRGCQAGEAAWVEEAGGEGKASGVEEADRAGYYIY